MKKVILCLVVLMLPVLCVMAEADAVKVGFLSRLNISEADFARLIQDGKGRTGWKFLSPHHDTYSVRFYDTLAAMQMALQRGDIDEIAIPEAVAQYLLKASSGFEVSTIAETKNPTGLAFGFMKNNADLLSKFNRALWSMESDGTLAELQAKYIYSDGTDISVKFDTFDGADTVKVAVTGDLPSIDFIDTAGSPAGFNAALLSELGRRMKVNIQLVNIESVARTASLTSGRVDVVFWYEIVQGIMLNYDASEGVLLSDPYFKWNKFIFLKTK